MRISWDQNMWQVNHFFFQVKIAKCDLFVKAFDLWLTHCRFESSRVNEILLLIYLFFFLFLFFGVESMWMRFIHDHNLILELSADDYLCKYFSTALARTRSGRKFVLGNYWAHHRKPATICEHMFSVNSDWLLTSSNFPWVNNFKLH